MHMAKMVYPREWKNGGRGGGVGAPKMTDII